MNQYAYLDKIIECFGLQNTNSTPIPLPQGYYSIKEHISKALTVYVLSMIQFSNNGQNQKISMFE